MNANSQYPKIPRVKCQGVPNTSTKCNMPQLFEGVNGSRMYTQIMSKPQW